MNKKLTAKLQTSKTETEHPKQLTNLDSSTNRAYTENKAIIPLKTDG